jgi:conjugation system TraG family ATPase
LLFIGFSITSKTEIKITDNATELSEVLPVQYIDNNFIVNGSGDITVGYKIFLPEVFTLSDEETENIHERIEALLGMLPSGTIVHQQNFYYTNTYKNQEHSHNFLQAENLAYNDGKAVLHSYSNIYLTFCNRKNQKRNYGASSLLRKQNFPFKQPFKDFLKLKEDIESIIMNFENGLSSISLFSIKKMRDHDLNNAIYDYINQSYDTPTNNAKQEVVNPISVTPESNLKIGHKLIAILSLIEEGRMLHTNTIPHTSNAHSLGTTIQMPSGIKSKCSMIFPVGLGLPFNHVLNTIIEITDNDAVVSDIRSGKNSLNFLANFYQPAKEKQREQEDFCNMVMQQQYQTAYTAVNVIINDPDKQELNRKIALAQQGFVSMSQAACYIENEETCNLLFASIPGNARANYRGFVNTTKQAICYLQKENMYLSDERGYIFSDRFGTPVKIDLWNYPGLVNRNKILIGPSGSGKSFLLNNYILQSIEKKNDIMIIDIGGSYRSLIDLNRGKYFDSTERVTFAFNPFLCSRDKAGNYIYIDSTDEESRDDLIKTISTILSFIWKGNEKISNTEKALLEKSIRAFYQYVNENSIFPNLIEYAKFLNHIKLDDYEKEKFDIRELILLLEPYVVGELAFLLNAHDNVDIINDNLIAFDMEDVSKKDYFPIVAIITLQLIVEKIKKRQGVAKTLIIDEALDFLKDEKFGDFIGYLYRTFRKKEGEVILAAQNVLFIKMAAPLIRDSIIINCATKMILDHNEHRSNLVEVQNILSITNDERTMVESLQKHERWREFFIKIGNNSFIFRNEVSPFAAVAFDSRQSTIVKLKQLFKETGSTYAALNKYLEQHKLV